MRLPKVRELGEALKALVRGPYTVRFPQQPHVPYPSFRGLPKFNQERCVGCLACEQVCPAEAIAHQDVIEETVTGRRRAKRVLIHYTDTCIFCGQCEAACIANHEGIKSSKEWDLAFFDCSRAYESIEKELELCERCGNVIGCKDHLAWICEQVGELSYASPTLYLSHHKQLGLIDENMRAAMDKQGRGDRFQILCARCRRETTLTTKDG
ncbi:MAG: 4Fe-4S dicluster domain-containing protein [Candidatus Binatia bacterium]